MGNKDVYFDQSTVVWWDEGVAARDDGDRAAGYTKHSLFSTAQVHVHWTHESHRNQGTEAGQAVTESHRIEVWCGSLMVKVFACHAGRPGLDPLNGYDV